MDQQLDQGGLLACWQIFMQSWSEQEASQFGC